MNTSRKNQNAFLCRSHAQMSVSCKTNVRMKIILNKSCRYKLNTFYAQYSLPLGHSVSKILTIDFMLSKDN
jgi:hypothetical protein